MHTGVQRRARIRHPEEERTHDDPTPDTASARSASRSRTRRSTTSRRAARANPLAGPGDRPRLVAGRPPGERADRSSTYWEREYDWRRFESALNAFPQFLTTIDGLDIHFIHVRSANPDALPLVLTHGWPGSIVDFLGLIGPLTDPVAYGGDVGDSFDVVIPSLPGFGFSGKPTETGWDVDRIAAAWAELMRATRLRALGGPRRRLGRRRHHRPRRDAARRACSAST